MPSRAKPVFVTPLSFKFLQRLADLHPFLLQEATVKTAVD